jgi:hypothetical protein
MYHSIAKVMLPLLVAALLSGCGQRSGTPPAGTAPPEDVKVDPARYLLPTEPAHATGVIDSRKNVQHGDSIVIVGKIGGSKKPVNPDRAQFTIVDLSLKACDGDPNCWDFA